MSDYHAGLISSLCVVQAIMLGWLVVVCFWMQRVADEIRIKHNALNHHVFLMLEAIIEWSKGIDNDELDNDELGIIITKIMNKDAANGS